jgi:hypothetical protein
LTIADSDNTEGLLNLTILKRGKSTRLLADLDVGDVLSDVASIRPLKPFLVEIALPKGGKNVLITG